MITQRELRETSYKRLQIDRIWLLCAQNLNEIIFNKSHSHQTIYQGISNIISLKEKAILKSLAVMYYFFEQIVKKCIYVLGGPVSFKHTKFSIR